MSDPTPLPWTRQSLMLIGANGDVAVHCATYGGRHLGPESEANAILIHKAVNMHERLVGALEESIGNCSVCGGSGTMNLYGGDETEIGMSPGSANRDCTYCVKARALLAEAEEAENG